MARENDQKAARELQIWTETKKAIIQAQPDEQETNEQKDARIKRLLKDYPAFSKYYFPHLVTSDMAWFHKKSANHLIDNDDTFDIHEFPREHAKSIQDNVLIPMHLKALGKLTGMMIGSANKDKAAGLLGDIQAELMFNARYINDFGQQHSVGNWQDGFFATIDGVGFWAFGRGQSPRGTRKAEKRPNYGVIDDIDDAVICRNTERVLDAVDWVLGDFYGAMSLAGSRLVIAGNRIHKKSILAHLVGDVEIDDPKRKGIFHLKVFALENPRTHKKDLSENGVPAWPENFTRQQILDKMLRQGWRIGKREFFHEHIVIGRHFKEEHLPWAKLDPIGSYDKLVSYNDPSFKGTKKNDFKGIILIGRKGRYFDVFKAFVRQCSIPEMIRGHYHIASLVPESKICRHYMEANFIQDILLEDYFKEGDKRGYYMNIRGDKRKKPDKDERIESLTPMAEQGYLRFNIAEKQSPDMQELRNQFLSWPDGPDDGPDAVEGGVHKLNTGSKKGNKSRAPRTGKRRRNESRRA